MDEKIKQSVVKVSRVVEAILTIHPELCGSIKLNFFEGTYVNSKTNAVNTDYLLEFTTKPEKLKESQCEKVL